jgi:hypothetical protein
VGGERVAAAALLTLLASPFIPLFSPLPHPCHPLTPLHPLVPSSASCPHGRRANYIKASSRSTAITQAAPPSPFSQRKLPSSPTPPLSSPRRANCTFTFPLLSTPPSPPAHGRRANYTKASSRSTAITPAAPPTLTLSPRLTSPHTYLPIFIPSLRRANYTKASSRSTATTQAAPPSPFSPRAAWRPAAIAPAPSFASWADKP